MSIIIIGGGITGATLALAISRLTFGTLLVHLIEAVMPQSKGHTEFDTRAIVLAHGTCQQLASIGIWTKISKYATPIRSVHIRDHSYTDLLTFQACDYNINSLGQVITLKEIRLKLFHLLTVMPGIVLHCPTRVINIFRNSTNASVKLDNGKILNGKLIIAANGSRSTLASQCGITWKKKFYNQMAIISNITTTIDHAGHAWECFTKHGSVAVLPMSQDRCFLVWCSKNASNIMMLSNDRFCIEIQKVFGYRLGRIVHAEDRNIYPLVLITATQFISHRMVLVGNAAQTIHPIIGQGFNLAMRDIMSLAELIAQAWIERKDYGSYSILSHYQNRRQLDKEITINITDGLVRLFESKWMPLVIGRKLGLITIRLFIPIRNMLARRALGWIPY